MVTAIAPSLPPDQRILLSGRTWEQFRLIQRGFAESPGIRLAYYNGTIEIIMPGRDHEVFKGIINLLLSLFFEVNQIEFVHPSFAALTLNPSPVLGEGLQSGSPSPALGEGVGG